MKRFTVLAMLLVLVMHVPAAEAASRYTLTRLGYLGAGYPQTSSGYSMAYGLNDLGHVVGRSTNYYYDVTQAFIWKDGVMTGLGSLMGPATTGCWRG